MTNKPRLLRNAAALGCFVAIFLVAALARAESAPAKPAKSAKAPSRTTAARSGRATAAAPVVSVEEGLQQIKKTPKDPGAYLALGGAYRRAGRYQEAADTYKKLIAIDPNNSTAHVSLGAAFMDLKRPDEAEREVRRALKINSQ